MDVVEYKQYITRKTWIKQRGIAVNATFSLPKHDFKI